MIDNICLILNDREPIPEDSLRELDSLASFVWAQDVGRKLPLSSVLKANVATTALITTYMDLSSKNLELLPDLQAIITTTTAVEYIDLDYCLSKGICVMNTPDYTGASVAEFAIALMFSAARNIPNINSAVRKGDFELFDFIWY